MTFFTLFGVFLLILIGFGNVTAFKTVTNTLTCKRRSCSVLNIVLVIDLLLDFLLTLMANALNRLVKLCEVVLSCYRYI